MTTTPNDLELSTDTISSDLLWERLQDKDYRESFVAAQLSHGIPYQVRELMDAQGLSQSRLAELGHISQATLSRATDPHYASLTSKSILGIAAGLDVAFIGQFVPFSELIAWFDRLPEWNRKSVLRFTEEHERRKQLQRTKGADDTRLNTSVQRSTKGEANTDMPDVRRMAKMSIDKIASDATSGTGKGWAANA